jgi:hypothetical protein
MKIAVILFGQPRDYINGHYKIMEYCNKQEGYSFDFFYHCWTIEPNKVFRVSPWRILDKTTITYTKETPEHLKELYNPVACKYENQNDVKFNRSLYDTTYVMNNTTGDKLNNVDNILFQLYSRNKARNLLYTYIKETNVHYDCVITTRFDTLYMPNLNLIELDLTKTYASNIHLPRRKILPDSCFITPMQTYLDWFTIFEDLQEILNNINLCKSLESFNEPLTFNSEDLIFAKYILLYKDLSNVAFFKGGHF